MFLRLKNRYYLFKERFLWFSKTKSSRLILLTLSVVVSLISLYFLVTILIQGPHSLTKKAVETLGTNSLGTEDFVPDKIFGQPNFANTVPNQVSGNRVYLPSGVTVDRVASPNRVYIWDSGNNRILGFSSLGNCSGGQNINKACTNNLDCPGSTCNIIADKKADKIFGQPDEKSATCNGDNLFRKLPGASTLCSIRYPYQISLDEGPSPNNLAVDLESNLYVFDKWNHRVLRYNNPFSSDSSAGKGDSVADFVWGQADFNSRECNRAGAVSANTLCNSTEETCTICESFSGAGVDVDLQEDVWVADGANHRVLRFPKASGYPQGNGNANLVLGQPNFNSVTLDACVNQPNLPPGNYLCRPKVARFNARTNQLFVLDWPNEISLFRILIFKAPFTNGMLPQEVIWGSPKDEYKSLVSVAQHPEWSYYRLNRPTGLEVDPFTSDAFWLSDAGNNRALYFQKIAGKWQPTKVLSQPNLERVQFGGGFVCSNSNHNLCDANSAGGIGIDSAGNIYLESNWWEQVLRFSAPIPTANPALTGDAGLGYAADVVIVKEQENAEMLLGVNLVSAYGIHSPNSVLAANYQDGTSQLLVGEMYRVLVWNDYKNKSSGAAADEVLFQNDFASKLKTGRLVRQMTVDSQGRIWMAKEQDGVYVFQGPVTSASSPIKIPLSLPINKSSQTLSLKAVIGLAYDELDDALWVADVDNYRVVRIYHPLSSDRAVDLVLGQPDLGSIKPNRSVDDFSVDPQCPNMFPDGFGKPSHLQLDNFGNLYIVDAAPESGGCGNNRLLEYDRLDLQNKLTEGKVFFNQGELVPQRVYGKSGFNKDEKNKYGQNGKPNTPISVSFTSDNQMVMVVDGYSNPNFERVFLLANPLPACSSPCRVNLDFSVLSPGNSPSAGTSYIIPLSIAQPSEAFFDKEQNLLIADHNWNRILFFNQPIRGSGPPYSPPNPTATATPSSSLTPTKILTPSPTPTLIACQKSGGICCSGGSSSNCIDRLAAYSFWSNGQITTSGGCNSAKTIDGASCCKSCRYPTATPAPVTTTPTLVPTPTAVPTTPPVVPTPTPTSGSSQSYCQQIGGVCCQGPTDSHCDRRKLWFGDPYYGTQGGCSPSGLLPFSNFCCVKCK